MTLDTKQKRGSAVSVSDPAREWLAEPSGTVSQDERQSLAKLSSAILASGVVSITGSGLMGSNQSTAISDSVKTPATLVSPGDQWSGMVWHKPQHNSTTTPASRVLSWDNVAQTAALGLAWDDLVRQQSWFHILTSGSVAAAAYVSSIPTTGWSNLIGRWGLLQTDGTKKQSIEAILNGEVDATTSAAHPLAGSATSIKVWADPDASANSAKGKLARVALWKDLALSNAEVIYLANGGHPRSVRPSSPSSLVLYLPFASDDSDYGSGRLDLTKTGTTRSTESPLNLLSPAADMGRDGNTYASFFRGGYSPDHFDYQMYLGECTDGTGTNFDFRPCYCPNQAGHSVRDTDVIYDSVTGKWWMACINQLLSISDQNGWGNDFGLYTSDNGVDWRFVQNVDCSVILGIYSDPGNKCRCWSGRWFIDSDNTIHLITVLIPAGGHTCIYEMHPQDRNNLAGAWSVPVKLTGSALPADLQGPQIIKEGSTYYLWYLNWATFGVDGVQYVEVASSTSLTSGYNTAVKTGDWAGWGITNEGNNVAQRPDGRWVMYMDHIGQGAKFSISSIAGSLSTVLASATWSTIADVLRMHGLVAIAPNFIPQGFTVHRVPGTNPELKPTTGLTSLWTFNGDCLDHVGTNDLTNNGSTLYTTGKVYAQAANLVAASSQSFSIAINTSLNVGFTSWTLGGWFKMATLTDMCLWSQDDFGSSPNDRVRNCYYDNSTHKFNAQKFGDDGLKTVTPNLTPSAGVYYLVFVSWDYVTDTFKMWVNGTTDSIATTGMATGTTALLRIGGFSTNGAGTDFWNGTIGDVMYWNNRALSDTEMTQIYAAGAGIDLIATPPARVNRKNNIGIGTGL